MRNAEGVIARLFEAGCFVVACLSAGACKQERGAPHASSSAVAPSVVDFRPFETRGDVLVALDAPYAGETSARAPRPATHWAKLLAAADARIARPGCAEVIKAYFDRFKDGGDREKERSVFEGLASSPPEGLSSDVSTRCAAYLRVQTEANPYVTVMNVIHAQANEKAAGGSACPSARPLPATLPAFGAPPYEPTADDRADPGWRCVVQGYFGKIEGQLEYRRRSDFTFDVIVRRPAPTDGEAPTEYVVASRRGEPSALEVR
jgi:hypothetical protein